MNISKIDAKTLASIVSEKAMGLTAHFIGIRDGKTPTARSPLYKSLEVDQVTEAWKDTLSRNASNFSRLTEYEDTRWAKFGPQGGYPPLKERMEKLEGYFAPTNTISLSPAEYESLVQQTREALFGNTHSLRALTPEQVLKRDVDEEKVNTNSGLPDFSKRNAPEVQTRAVQDAKSGKWKEYPAVIGSRGQRQKDRFIFMFPMSTNLVEKQYVIPIMEAIRAHGDPSFSAWEGFDEVEVAMHKQGMLKGKTKVSMDYEKMDNLMRKDKSKFVDDVCSPVFQPQYRKGLLESLMHVNEIPIMISETEVTSGDHGYASGSGWTNLGESIMAKGVHLYIGMQEKSLIGTQLLGDDGALGFSDDLQDKAAQVIETIAGKFGLIANSDKQRVDPNTLIYLQRFFDTDILVSGTDVVAGSYPTVLALNSAMNPERFHDARKWSEDMEILRWISICENTKHHPLFHDFVEFIAKGDKFDLGRKKPGFLKRGIVETFKEAKTMKGFMPSYNEASKNRSIEDFETVKYLRATS